MSKSDISAKKLLHIMNHSSSKQNTQNNKTKSPNRTAKTLFGFLHLPLAGLLVEPVLSCPSNRLQLVTSGAEMNPKYVSYCMLLLCLSRKPEHYKLFSHFFHVMCLWPHAAVIKHAQEMFTQGWHAKNINLRSY